MSALEPVEATARVSVMPAHHGSDYITIVKASQPLGKRFTRLKNGEVKKEAGGFVSEYIAWSVHVPDLEALAEALAAVGTHEATIMGWMPGSEDGNPYKLVSEGRLKKALKLKDDAPRPVGWHEIDGQGCTGRFKDNFQQSSYILFDRDIDECLPDELVAETDADWWAQMAQICPALAGAGRLITPSSSNRVLLPDGSLAKPSPATHTFVKVQDASDVERFGKMLDVRAWLNNFGYIRTGNIGQQLKRTIFDVSVFTPERLVFESAPVAGKGLKVGKASSRIIDGGTLDTSALPDLSTDEDTQHTNLTGRTLKQGNGTCSLMFNSSDLCLDMPIVTKNHGTITVREYHERKPGKIRVQTPYRESDSWAAYLNTHKNGVPFLFDSGSQTKHLLLHEDVLELIGSEFPKHPANDNKLSLQIEDWGSLSTKEFEPIEWVIEDLLPPGVSLLSGRPKQGKSWLVHAWGLLVAAERPVFGLKTHRSKVLYMALEDSDRRLKLRTSKLMDSHSLFDNDLAGYFFKTTEAKQLGKGLESQLDELLTANPDMRLVIIDVLARIRQERRPNQSVYESDYEVGRRLKNITAKFPHVALLIVHHTNKSGLDALDAISGTNGLAGGVDNTFSMINGSSGLELHINGRDIEDSAPIPLIKGPDGMWEMISRAEAWKRTISESRAKIAEAMKAGETSPTDIATASGLDINLVGQQLRRLVKKGQIVKVKRGSYALVLDVRLGVSFTDSSTGTKNQ